MKRQIVLVLLLNLVVRIEAAAIQENVVTEEDDQGDADQKKCPGWGPWQSSKCLWPSQEFSSLPKSCTDLPKKPVIPDLIKQYVQSKQIEIYSAVQNLFKLRGANDACGYCSRKIRCRQTKGGEWKKGCKFIQAQIVNEQCAGTKACEINSILGACPPPVPNPRPRRRPGQSEISFDFEGPISRIQKMADIDQQVQGDKDLEIDADKNTTQGPPLWHCVRNKDGKKCLCCCGWYLPDAKSGKCVSLKKDETTDSDVDQDDVSWNWSGLTDSSKLFPLNLADAGDQIVEQIEAPPMNNVEQPDRDDTNAPPIEQAAVDEMAEPPKPPMPTVDQLGAPPMAVVEVHGAPPKAEKTHEINEI